MSTPSERKFYMSARWRKVRKLVLERDAGLCLNCKRYGRLTEANEVDHIRPMKDYPDLALTLDNLQTICRTCHARKTRADSRPDLGICPHGHIAWACPACTEKKP